jgi:hypothetical protein
MALLLLSKIVIASEARRSSHEASVCRLAGLPRLRLAVTNRPDYPLKMYKSNFYVGKGGNVPKPQRQF